MPRLAQHLNGIENEFAIFTKNTWNSSEDIQWNMIFWFMDICKCLDLDIFNSTSLNITTLTFSGNVIPTLILTVKIKHKLEFEI